MKQSNSLLVRVIREVVASLTENKLQELLNITQDVTTY
jgi:hypothetical protein